MAAPMRAPIRCNVMEFHVLGDPGQLSGDRTGFSVVRDTILFSGNADDLLNFLGAHGLYCSAWMGTTVYVSKKTEDHHKTLPAYIRIHLSAGPARIEAPPRKK